MSCLQSVHAFLMPFFCSAKSPWPWRLGGNSPPCEGPVAWNGCGRRRAATGAPRKKGNLGTRRNLCPGRKQKMRGKNMKKQQQQSSLCITLHLSSFLTRPPPCCHHHPHPGDANLFRHLYHHSLFWNPPHAKQTPFISPYQPSHPESKISDFTGSPRLHTLDFDGWFLQLYSIIMCARLSKSVLRRCMNTWC